MVENGRGRKKRSEIREGGSGSGSGGGEESTTTSATVGGVGKPRAVQVEGGHHKPPSSPSTTNSISHRSNKMVITAVGSPSLPSSSSTDQLQSQAHRGRTAASTSPTTTTTPTTPTIMSRSRGRTSTTSTRVRATVKETGSDSISTYIKSLVQHELLYKEDEILLGRQVRMLSKLEEKRSELELQLLR